MQENFIEFTQWLHEAAISSQSSLVFDQMIIDKLRAYGIPIVRFASAVPSLHPQVEGFSCRWTIEDGISFHEFFEKDLLSDEYQGSPFQAAFEQAQSQNFDLTSDVDHKTLVDLKKHGLTGYVVLALPFSDGTNKAMSFATNEPDGFSSEHVEFLMGIRTTLAAMIEVRYLKYTAGMLMDTYVGPIAGRRVLKGEISRGSGEQIEAVIWFCDLKGFTVLSEKAETSQLIDVLNAYFEATCSAIEAEDGEVLKFIGDAVLAIFQGNECMSENALRAANRTVQNLEKVNDTLEKDNMPLIECGIALHCGEVTYGNIGAPNRLDFTVIGRDVNLASRIEALTRNFKSPILVSELFAKTHGGNFNEMGQFSLKGLEGEHKVYVPAD